MIERAEGTDLIDAEGRRYIDGVSSLWCNVHGHRHPLIDAGAARPARPRRPLDDARAHPPRRRGARRRGWSRSRRPASSASSTPSRARPRSRSRSRWRFSTGASARATCCRRTSFVCLTDGYHGDTIGSVSVGGIDLFHGAFGPLLFKTYQVDPGDERKLERVLDLHAREIAAVIVEPLVQGAAGIRVQPPGYLRRVRELSAEHGVLMIADEVATGFGRTGTMFACEQERVDPDFLCLGKGLTGGYLPLAATLDDRARSTRGSSAPTEDYRTFFHGHTFTGNPLACAAAIASLEVFEQRGHPAAAAAEDPAARRAARRASSGCPRSPRSAAAGSWSGSTSASTTRRCASATG